MSLSIDEIYDLFTWDPSLSDAEYEARTQKGIAEASKLKNMYPFIQPVIADAKPGGISSKSTWEPCAKVVALKSDEELKNYVYMLLEWLQDMNWPGFDIIFERLSQIPYPKMEAQVESCILRAKQENDEAWLDALEELRKQSVNLGNR